ncbi:hypothetical protein ACI7MU_00020 [Pseudomonas sp. 2024-64]
MGIHLPDGSDVAYRYDALGRRIAKDLDGKTIQFIWQGDRLIAVNIYQKGVCGWPLYSSYVYEPGTFKPMVLVWRRITGRSATSSNSRMDSTVNTQSPTATWASLAQQIKAP